MAIPHPSQLLTPRQRLILRSSLAVAALSSTYLILLWIGGLPTALRPAAQCPPLRTSEGPCRPDCGACPPEAARPQPQASPAAVALVREPGMAGENHYSVCEATSGEPIVRVLQLTAEAPALAVHCGASVHVFAFDEGQPRRVAHFNGRGTDRGLTEQAGALLVLDFSGDGASDLIIGSYRRDEHGSPHSGALYQVLRLANGGFGEARALAPFAVGGAAAIDLHTPGAADLAVLRLDDARVGRGNEVVLLRGGPAPLKVGALPAGIGMNQIAAADLDLDGNMDLIVAGSGRAADVVYLDARGQPLRRTALDPGPVQAALVADLDGDGHEDLVIASDESRVILARSGSTAIAHPLALPQGFHALRAVDWNGDAKIDLLGQQEQSLLAMIQTDKLAFERTELATWPEQELRIHSALWSGPHTASPAALVLIASPVQARGQVELLVSRQVPWVASKLRATAIPAAPLSLQLSLL